MLAGWMRVCAAILGSLLCAWPAAAQNYYFSAATGCITPEFVYLVSTQNRYRDLLATVMLAKALGKRVAFYGNCSGPDSFSGQYAILID